MKHRYPTTRRGRENEDLPRFDTEDGRKPVELGMAF